MDLVDLFLLTDQSLGENQSLSFFFFLLFITFLNRPANAWDEKGNSALIASIEAESEAIAQRILKVIF